MAKRAKRVRRVKRAVRKARRHSAARKVVRTKAKPRRNAARRPLRTARKATAARTRKPAARKNKKKVLKATKPRPARKTRRPRAVARALRPASLVARTAPRAPRLDRVRRQLEDVIVPTPPSTLAMNPHGSAASTGRAEILQSLKEHATMGRGITGGDVDASMENAYFSGDGTPGGDNPTPDQDIVDEIGRAVGIEYDEGEELKASDKVADRDKHRWELDPASSEDYRER